MHTLFAVILSGAALGQVPDIIASDSNGGIWEFTSGGTQAKHIGNTGFAFAGLALTPAGRLLGVTQDGDQLREISLETGVSQLVRAGLDFHTPNPFVNGSPEGFTIASNGVGYVATDESFGFGGLFEISPTNGDLRRIATLGNTPRGALAFDDNGELLMTTCATSNFLQQCSNTEPDDLIGLNIRTGEERLIGSLGVAGMTGLANAGGGSLVGFTGSGEVYHVNPANAQTTLIGVTDPRILTTGATALSSRTPPPASQRLESTLPAIDPSATELFDVIHGWRGLFNDPPDWTRELATAIEQRVTGRSVQVVATDWAEDASGGVSDLSQILSTGHGRGILDGSILAEHGLPHVSVVADSAGAAYGQALLQEVERRSPATTTELILTDPYTPHHSYAAWYGADLDYALNLFVSDSTTGQVTEIELPHAHNVNMDGVAPFIWLPSKHNWVHRAYQQTVEAAVQDPDYSGYGWPMSHAFLTAGDDETSWPPRDRPINNGVAHLPLTGDEGVQVPLAVRTARTEALALTDFEKVVTGAVTVDGTKLQMQTAAEQDALIVFTLPDRGHSYNFLELKLAWLSEHEDAEGFLTIGHEGTRLTFDERFETDERSVFFPLTAEARGLQQLSLQLDGFGDYESQIEISGVVLGQHVVERAQVGDSNLDGFFDSADLITVFAAGEYEDDLIGNSTWMEGDWDLDGDFTSADVVAAFGAGRYTALLVPEPSASPLLLALLWLRRRA